MGNKKKIGSRNKCYKVRKCVGIPKTLHEMPNVTEVTLPSEVRPRFSRSKEMLVQIIDTCEGAMEGINPLIDPLAPDIKLEVKVKQEFENMENLEDAMEGDPACDPLGPDTMCDVKVKQEFQNMEEDTVEGDPACDPLAPDTMFEVNIKQEFQEPLFFYEETAPCDDERLNNSKSDSPNKNVIFKNTQNSPKVLKNNKKCGRIIEIQSRSHGQKFVLPVRSVHSSRAIKPNKRFQDDNDYCKSFGNKKRKLKSKSGNNSACSSVEKSAKEWYQLSTDVENIDLTECSSSTASAASSSFRDEHFSSRPEKRKLLMHKTKPNVQRNPQSPKGAGDYSHLIPQKVVCGVCSAVRYYRHVKQARKFGIYSCESCRKFITRTISNPYSEPITCRTGKGTCVIPQYVKDPLTRIVNRNVMRCKACWLKMCLRRYFIPDHTYYELNRRLPLSMRTKDPLFQASGKSKNKTEVNKVTRDLLSKCMALTVRVVPYIPYTQGRSPLAPVPTSASRKYGSGLQRTSCVKKKIKHRKKVVQNKGVALGGYQSDSQVFSTKMYDSKFVLPVRSAYSSRVIKPNKRFRDFNVGTKSCNTEKVKHKNDTFNNNSTSSSN